MLRNVRVCCAYVHLAEPADVTDNDQYAADTPRTADQNIAQTSDDLASSQDLDLSEDTSPAEDRGRSGHINGSEDEGPALESVEVVDGPTEMSDTPSSDAATQTTRKIIISKIRHFSQKLYYYYVIILLNYINYSIICRIE